MLPSGLSSRLDDGEEILAQVGVLWDQFNFGDLVNPSLEKLVIEPILSSQFLKRVRQILEVRSNISMEFNGNLSSKPAVGESGNALLKHRLD